jgi:hypothetical protein
MAPVQCKSASRNQSRSTLRGGLEGLELQQISRGYGTLNVFINDSVLRVKMSNQNRYMLAWAPKWQVYAVNDSTHTYSKSTSASSGLLMQRAMLIEGGDLSKCHWVPLRKGKIAGLAALKMGDAAIHRKSNLNNQDSQTQGYENLSDELRREGFWVADIKVAPGAADCLATITGLPKCGRVPLHFLHLTSTARHPMSVLDTSSSKIGRLEARLTRLPANYKESTSEFDSTVESIRNLVDEDK